MAVAPENTLPAFAAAIDASADGVELDVHPTRDSALVVHHDYYLDRLTDGSGLVSDRTLTELRALDAGSWFGPQFAGERIPRLEEVLELGHRQLRFEIELKGSTVEFLEQVLAAIHAAGVVDRVEVTSPHVPLLRHAREREPDVDIGLFIAEWPAWMGPELGQRHVIDWLTLTGAQVAHVPSPMIDASFARRLHDLDMRLHAPNLNDATAIRHAVLCGVDRFTTDRIALALATLAQT